jgi:putative YphP/YqiW family bacilliredoxin
MDLNAQFTRPMREELTAIGFKELRTPADVDAALAAKTGSALVFVNSVCGCAAGMARPGMALALQGTEVRPDQLVTVFAGQDRDATARAREYFAEAPPSSPSIALLKDGALVGYVPRHQIEGRSGEAVGAQIAELLDAHCAKV